MSYVGDPFKYDLFVTYSHGDDGSGNAALRHWSGAFVRELNEALTAIPDIGRALQIFLDQKYRPGQGVDPMAPLSDQLRAEIERSAILTVLMSPHYLGSNWCKDEREWWQQRQAALELAIEGRIALARIWPTEDADASGQPAGTPVSWPPLFTDARGHRLPGFCFHEPDAAQARMSPWPFEWPAPTRESRDPFRRTLLGMAGWISHRLRELRRILDENRRKREDAERIGAPDGQVIYLHGRPDDSATWEQAGSALSDSGFVVLPSAPESIETDPGLAARARELRIQTISGCDALLLVGSQRRLEADLVMIGRQDRHSARDLAKRLLPCAVLDVMGAGAAGHRRTARGLGIDWLEANPQDVPPHVRDWLQGQAAAARAEA